MVTTFVQKFGNFTTYVDLDDEQMTAKQQPDQKEEDVVYAVYLRKVRYPKRMPDNNGINHWIKDSSNRPRETYYSSPFDGGELDWESVLEKVLKAGTLPKLVHSLVLPSGEIDSRHFNVFFATFRAFAKPTEVLRAILAEVHVVLSDRSKLPKSQYDSLLKTWHNILLWWLDLYTDDFRDHPHYQCLTHLIEFSRVQQGLFQDVFAKAVRHREEFCRSFNNSNTAQNSLDKLTLVSPNEGFDSYVLNPRSSKSPDISNIDPVYVAEQLTYWDAEIFKRLIPHQCQSCFWSRRNKSEQNSSTVYTVKATIDQFNAVSRRVMSTVVHLLHVKTAYRARVISAWIEIAQELRILKNFSSLKAVLSGLQSEPVYRLKNVWNLVPNEKVKDFNELSRLFSEDDNYNGARALLEKEGTAKVVNIAETTAKDKEKKRHYRHRRTKSDMGDIQGTVPYLGTFLTDLTMVDSAYPDFVENDLINFDKRRKEFEIIARLRLFQSAARNYRISSDPKFRNWFLSLPSLSEQHCYHCSCLIDPPYSSTPLFTKEKRTGTWSKILHFLDEDFMSNGNGEDSAKKPLLPSSLPNSYSIPTQLVNNGGTPCTPHSTISYGRSVFYDQSQFSPELLWNEFFKNGALPSDIIGESPEIARNGNLSRLHSSVSIPSIINLPSSPRRMKSSTQNSLDRLQQTPPSTKHQNSDDQECYVIRVGLDDSLQVDPCSTTLYKCVKLENSDRTPKLIEKVLRKHQIDADPAHFTLVQLLTDGDELVLPERANAYYAVMPGNEMHFVLRKKSDVPPATLRLKKKRRRNLGGNMFRWSSGFL